jgi:hypothetical protein
MHTFTVYIFTVYIHRVLDRYSIISLPEIPYNYTSYIYIVLANPS